MAYCYTCGDKAPTNNPKKRGRKLCATCNSDPDLRADMVLRGAQTVRAEFEFDRFQRES